MLGLRWARNPMSLMTWWHRETSLGLRSERRHSGRNSAVSLEPITNQTEDERASVEGVRVTQLSCSINLLALHATGLQPLLPFDPKPPLLLGEHSVNYRMSCYMLDIVESTESSLRCRYKLSQSSRQQRSSGAQFDHVGHIVRPWKVT